MSILIEMYCILLIINSIVFSAVDNNSLQFNPIRGGGGERIPPPLLFFFV